MCVVNIPRDISLKLMEDEILPLENQDVPLLEIDLISLLEQFDEVVPLLVIVDDEILAFLQTTICQN
jgi:hypothetical protein